MIPGALYGRACYVPPCRGAGVWVKKAFGHGSWRVTWALNVLARAPILMAQADVMSLHSVPG
ncbi:hypothetical protein PY793_07415 [Acetobacter fabarum]|uniref:hypothetical protein n=1 Tax=Acetobacter fabarum TaxID=483199 RepID=UPI00312B5D60